MKPWSCLDVPILDHVSANFGGVKNWQVCRLDLEETTGWYMATMACLSTNFVPVQNFMCYVSLSEMLR